MNLHSSHKSVDPQIFLDANIRVSKFLKEHPAGVLSTADVNGDPHGAVIYYTADEALNVTFMTKTKTQKSDDLMHNNHAMLVVFDESAQTSVQMSGVVSEITDDAEIQQAFRNMLRASLHDGTAVPPIVKLHAGQFVAYRFKPIRIRLSAYAHPDVRGPGNMFEVIEVPV